MPESNQEPFIDPPDDEAIETRLRRVREQLESAELELGDRLPDDEVDARLGSMHSAISDATRPAATEPSDFDERLRHLEVRTGKVRDQQTTSKANAEREREANAKSSRGLGVGLSIAYTIIGIPLFGILFGWLADRQLGTNLYKGVGALVGAVIGIVFAVVLMNRADVDR